ncbi:retinol dehydrogenase 14 [Aspergillus udagawae]|uniref:Retinol dehydrogenase 14 n=1 Tax=Aspergillus udagawae TaxID=91492 RepID=A0ABQ1B7A8_9EURO|nr:retinol dehydrogenase 14 [Aspergillus udagawae]
MSSQQILPSETIIHRYGSSLAGKTILITGVSGNSIAGELAIQLSAAAPHLLILSGRAEERVTPVIEKIKSTAPNVNTRFLKMDLGDMSNITTAVETLHDIPKIDHLACVAGVMVPPYGTTKDGFETQFGVNYLANFLLVKLLLPKVKAAGAGSSIIIVASSSARGGKVHFEDVGFSEGKTYNPLVAYSQSNAARVLFVKALAEKLGDQGIRVFSIDPGAVQSGLQRHFTPEFQEMVAVLRASGGLVDLDGRPIEIPPFTSKTEGAATIITGMIDPTIQGHNGAFLHNNAVANDELNSHTRNHDNQAKLWKLSEQMTHETFAV